MLTAAALRKGRCPGALAPMAAKDGLLARLRISGGRLSAEAARAIAEIGRRQGNGLFDLTSRANLQMRGLTPAGLPPLHDALARFGWIDATAEGEAVRNVLVSPLSARDAPAEAAVLGRALEAALVADEALVRLPGKFGFLIDDGGPLSLANSSADVRFDFGSERQDFAVSVGGTLAEAEVLCFCPPGELAETGLRIARAFLQLGSALAESPRRMRDLLAAFSAATLAEAAGLRLEPVPPQGKAAAPIPAPMPIGLLQTGGASACFGAGAPLGRLDAAMLEALAEAAARFGLGEIRLTPWRAVLVPLAEAERASDLGAYLRGRGFITEPEDPRLALVACGGASACARGSTSTHADALALAPLARRLRREGVSLHVSGCIKACAHPAPAPYALVAREGLYDLFINGAPAGREGRGLSLDEAKLLLETLSREAESLWGQGAEPAWRFGVSRRISS